LGDTGAGGDFESGQAEVQSVSTQAPTEFFS
jgi:hypothetical protein